MNLKILLSFFLWSFWFSQAMAQNTLLWEISSPDLKDTSYIYGTMHTMDARAFEFNDSLKIVFDKCDAFAMEFTTDQENMSKVLAHMHLENGKQLKDLYSVDDYAFLSDAVSDILGAQIQMFERMQPFFLMSMIMQTQMKKDKSYFVDQYLYNMAGQRGMKALSIEKVEEQIKAVKEMTPQALIDYLKNFEESLEMMEKLVEAYRQQDLSKMLELSKKDTVNLHMMQALLHDRNIVMAERIGKMIHQHSTFIAVGALHLPGKGGIIDRLRQKGYKVRPIIAPYNSSID